MTDSSESALAQVQETPQTAALLSRTLSDSSTNTSSSSGAAAAAGPAESQPSSSSSGSTSTRKANKRDRRLRLRSLTNDQLKQFHTAAPSVSAPHTSLALAASLSLSEDALWQNQSSTRNGKQRREEGGHHEAQATNASSASGAESDATTASSTASSTTTTTSVTTTASSTASCGAHSAVSSNASTSQESASSAITPNSPHLAQAHILHSSPTAIDDDGTERTFQMDSSLSSTALHPWHQSTKARSKSAEGVLLAVQSRHQEAVAAKSFGKQQQEDVVAASGPLPSLEAAEEGGEEEADAGTLRRWRSSQGHGRGHSRSRSEVGQETFTQPRANQKDQEGEEEQIQALITFPSFSPDLQSASSTAQPAFAKTSLKRSNTTAGIPTSAPRIHDSTVHPQQHPQIRPRIESLRDLVATSNNSSNAAAQSANTGVWRQHGSYGYSSTGRMGANLQMPSGAPSAAPVGTRTRPRLSLQSGMGPGKIAGVGLPPSPGGIGAPSTSAITPKTANGRDESTGRRSGDMLRGPSSAPMSLNNSRDAQASTSKDPSVSQQQENTASLARQRTRTGLQGALEAKVVILGSQGVGKTSIVHRYTTGQFHASAMPSTIGASFLTKKLIVSGTKVRLQLWDTAGQERFRSMAPMYYRGSHAAVVVYDITNRKSLEELRSWVDELRKNMGDELTIHIVGAKKDLEREREVTIEQAREVINSWAHAPGSLPAVTITPPTRTGSRVSTFTNTLTTTRFAFPSASSFRNGAGGMKSPDFNNESVSPEHAAEKAFWTNIDVCEVSAKEDAGIEDVFFRITQRLVERKLAIERERALRERDSVVLTQPPQNGTGAGLDPASRGKWACCAS